ncbi:MAG: GTP-binding protein [Lachnospiraceae bacterium]|nr:GTP-binding protein [Lachnospiraceae bacterium]MDY4971765.1 GTP-binding protein [Lachnospiraceae bacterium]
MKILILGGFLGSGKTSFLGQLAQYLTDISPEKRTGNVVILENEIGQKGIDDKFLRSSGYQVENMFNGCVCCTLGGDLLTAVDRIQKQYQPEWMILETTGLAYPGLIQENLLEGLQMNAGICTLADASRWLRIRKPMEELLLGQIECADIVLINKADLSDDKTLSLMENDIHIMNPNAMIYRICALNGIDPKIMNRILSIV